MQMKKKNKYYFFIVLTILVLVIIWLIKINPPDLLYNSNRLVVSKLNSKVYYYDLFIDSVRINSLPLLVATIKQHAIVGMRHSPVRGVPTKRI